MATFVASQSLDMRTYFSLTDGQTELQLLSEPNKLTIVKSQSTFVATGTFTYDRYGEPVGGTVLTMQESWNGSLAWRVTGISVPIGTFQDFYDANDNFDDIGFGTYLFAGNDTITGSSGVDWLMGYGGNDSMAGGAGNDRLVGGAGADTLNGSSGADAMLGGAGNDIYFVDNATDKVYETTSTTSTIDAGGADKINSSVSFSLAAYQGVALVENLTLTGTAAINGFGNGLANTLIGNAAANVVRGAGGNDVLVGGSGSDTLYGDVGNDLLRGGAGNDVLYGGSGNDLFRFDAALSTATVSNVDQIKDFSPVQDTIQLENSIFTKLGATKTGPIDAVNFRANTTGLAQDSNDYLIYETDTGKLFYDTNGSAAGGSVQIALLQANLALSSADYVLV